MSHIDDGALHAYLDGALDSYPAEEAARVRAHLDACPDCAERLAEERGIRDEAEAILAASAPVVQMPPLEDLRALAQRRTEATHARGISRLNRWGWAASVVLALGSGWMLRGAVPDVISPQSVQETAPRPGVAERSADESREAIVTNAPEASESAGVDAAAGFIEAEAVSPADLMEAPARQQRDRDALAESEPAELGGLARGRGAQPTDFAAEEAIQPAAPPAAQAVATLLDSLGRAEEAQVGLSPAPAEQAMVERRAAAAARPLQFESRALQDSPGEPGPPSEADASKTGRRDDSPGLLVVPGLEVLQWAWVEGLRADAGVAGAAPGALRVRQLMEDGDTLEIVHMPPGSDPPALPRTPADGSTELVARHGEGWVILRGPVPHDTLEAYLRRLQGR